MAYATEEMGSEQNTGRAIRFGGSVYSSRSLRSGSPINSRDRTPAPVVMHQL